MSHGFTVGVQRSTHTAASTSASLASHLQPAQNAPIPTRFSHLETILDPAICSVSDVLVSGQRTAACANVHECS